MLSSMPPMVSFPSMKLKATLYLFIKNTVLNNITFAGIRVSKPSTTLLLCTCCWKLTAD